MQQRTTPVNGHVKSRPTSYRGVTMRSRLEAAWAEQFDAFGWGWQYEPEAFGDKRAGQYLPDFLVWAHDNRLASCYIEVKPAPFFDRPAADIRADIRRWEQAMERSTCVPLVVATVTRSRIACFVGHSFGHPVIVEVLDHPSGPILAEVMHPLINVGAPTNGAPIGSLWADQFGRQKA